MLKPMITYNNCNGNEILLYDFSLNIGDTIKEECFNGFTAVVITDIDTILIGNQLRKVFHFNVPFFNWVEGIGNVNMNNNGLGGLLYYVGDFPAKATWLINYLVCFKQNITIVYFNNNFPECMPLNMPIKPIMEDVVVSPNPSTTWFTITIPENSINATWMFYDIQGIPIQTDKTCSKETEINVASLPRGLYLLKVVTDKKTFVKKVMLQ